MLNCIYNNKRINAFIIEEKDEYMPRKNIRLELIRAGRENKLACEDCGHPVILKAGARKVPHFAHKQGFRALCAYDEYSSKESEVHKVGKKILFFYLKNRYPEADIQLDYPLSNKRRSNIYVEMHDKKLAIELQRFNINPEEWNKKFRDYQSLGIPNLWIVLENINQTYSYDNEKSMEFYKQMVLNESTDSTIVFLDVLQEKMTIGKNMVYKDIEGKKMLYENLFLKTYPLSEVQILLTGKIQSPFQNEYEKELKEFFKRCREKEQSMIVKSPLSKFTEYQIPMQQSIDLSSKFNHSIKQRNTQPYSIGKKNISDKRNYYNNNSFRKKNYYITSCIQKAKSGDSESMYSLIKMFLNSPDENKIIKGLFHSFIDSGDQKANELYRQILQRTGFPDDD